MEAPMPMADELIAFLTQTEAARLLRVSVRTLERWRLEGSGPSYRKFGRRVVYSRNDLMEWTHGCIRSSTAARNDR